MTAKNKPVGQMVISIESDENDILSLKTFSISSDNEQVNLLIEMLKTPIVQTLTKTLNSACTIPTTTIH